MNNVNNCGAPGLDAMDLEVKRKHKSTIYEEGPKPKIGFVEK